MQKRRHTRAVKYAKHAPLNCLFLSGLIELGSESRVGKKIAEDCAVIQTTAPRTIASLTIEDFPAKSEGEWPLCYDYV